MTSATNKPRRQIRDDAVYVRKRQMLATMHPPPIRPITRQSSNGK
jgi:hypothetical protein